MRKEYNKLVRDLIPDIICRDGRDFEIEIMTEGEYQQALRVKLVEEAQEAAAAEPEKLSTELADICEIVDAIMAAYDIERESVIQEQLQRRKSRGGFEKRIRLLWTE